MESFANWLRIKESSASTRLKRQAAFGLAPPTADIFGHSTPPAWEVKRLKKALKKSKKKKKKLNEGKIKPVIHTDIDSFIKSVQLLAKDLWELDFLKKKKAAQDKMNQIGKKSTGKPISPEKAEKTPEENEKNDKKISKPNIKPKKSTKEE